ncbi:MAG: YwaF family protein [Clostridia bacterium]|nr:YwaF family protein [Clostridia bacterium]
MVWGSFGAVHLISLALAAGIIAGLYFWLRRCGAKTQTWVLGILSFSGVCAMVFNLVAWGSPLEYLPFHLCSLTAMILPFAVLTGSRILNNLLLLWGLGALAALVMNTAQAEFLLLSPAFFFYYFPHVFEFGVVVLMFLLGRVKKDAKCILPTLGITVLAYTAAHFVNLAVNAYSVANDLINPLGGPLRVNYMFSLTPENPLLQLFYDILPVPYWYMFLCIPIIAVYLCCIYTPELMAAVRARKNKIPVSVEER